MTASSRQEKPGRPREVLLAVVLPLIRSPVRLLVQLGVNPLWIVVVHAACAALAAWFIFLGPAWWPAAGVLLLIRMLLDNIDGAVARGSGSVTVAGRYLDTGLDLVTNFLLFLALTAVSGTVPALLRSWCCCSCSRTTTARKRFTRKCGTVPARWPLPAVLLPVLRLCSFHSGRFMQRCLRRRT